jgi:hypothetical protein
MKMTLSLLLTLFVGFKLANIINWSWWWVISPLWVPLVIGLVSITLFCLVKGLIIICKGRGSRCR